MNTFGTILAKALKGKTTVEREEIAGRIGVSRRTLDSVMKGASDLNLDQIGRLSDVIEIDLFAQYFEKTGRKDLLQFKEPGPTYVKPQQDITLSFNLKGTAESFGNFQSFLSDLKKVGAKYGLDVI